jgi:hypothetical protein
MELSLFLLSAALEFLLSFEKPSPLQSDRKKYLVF